MKNLRRDFERFCYRHRNKGIPNLMLFIALGTAIMYVFMMIDPSNLLYSALCFDRTSILHGQIWRLLTYIFIPSDSNPLLLAISLFFYYVIGRAIENSWGPFRFNLFYFTGMLITDIAALLLGVNATVGNLNLSLVLAFATMFPENQVLLFFIIPLKMKYLAWVYFALTIWEVIAYPLPYNLFPIFALLNYFLFFGSDILAVLRQLLYPEEAEAQPQLGQRLPEQVRSEALSPQVHGLRPHRYRLPQPGVPLLLQMQGLLLLLHRPHQQPRPYPVINPQRGKAFFDTPTAPRGGF